ncbi:MAG: hypothetical protein FJY10_05125 [Bacteroidetes bacterium]|nr:hypothetical protein [Bacteroidota bacterium]
MCLTFIRIAIIAGLAAGLFLSGCDDPNYAPESFPNVSTENPSFQFNLTDASGVLVASQSYIFDDNGYPVPEPGENLALAFFPGSPGSTLYVPAGEIVVNSRQMDIQPDTTYVFNDPGSPISFSSGVIWNVSGSPMIEPLNETLSNPFPSYILNRILPDHIKRLDGFTLYFGQGAFQNASSVVAAVHSGDKYASQLIPSNAVACSFLAEELGQLPPSESATIQVTARFKKKKILDENKNIYFVNQAIYCKKNVALK